MKNMRGRKSLDTLPLSNCVIFSYSRQSLWPVCLRPCPPTTTTTITRSSCTAPDPVSWPHRISFHTPYYSAHTRSGDTFLVVWIRIQTSKLDPYSLGIQQFCGYGSVFRMGTDLDPHTG